MGGPHAARDDRPVVPGRRGRRGAVNVLTIGPGEASRIYRSTDDGRTWTESFRNTDANAFYDCMAFYPGDATGSP
ncbi:hypothetical protein [Arsenicicoccus piscis]|uniref:Exo-alpha-sialidase n=1 Tax=Arsenicicoccus piscis TaxID=673954 RepID=A0ABQ6HNI4_9MICO|nr:hypothetical protein [Arsenicicoccus piscis]GMA19685.1 hypothetical protein GCM10025862_17060 [Arsenicicoccus piscis]